MLNVEDVIKMFSDYHATAKTGKQYDVRICSIIKCLKDISVIIRNR